MIKKLLCKLGLHNWAYVYVNGGMYRHAVARKCKRKHCLRTERKDEYAGPFENAWHTDDWYDQFNEQQKRNSEFINKKP